jgi:hypothetical protein
MNWISYMSSRVPEYNIYCYLVLIELVLAFYRFHRLFLLRSLLVVGSGITWIAVPLLLIHQPTIMSSSGYRIRFSFSRQSH